MQHSEDSVQRAVIEMHGKVAMVLAPPGCGKTYILAHRVFHANAMLGVPMEQMLCVTFTNRAAREMRSRIDGLLGRSARELFVGNMHRFCMRFLFANGIVPDDTTVFDEEDMAEYYYTTFGLRRAGDIADFERRMTYIYQCRAGHPEWLRRVPESPITQTDLERYDILDTFKTENKLITYDDMLLLTYTALMSPDYRSMAMTSYSWIQVDEVQDMTPLQLAIVDKVSRTDAPDRTVLYLGDEQQAIFGFIGAGGRALDTLKRLCAGHVMHLSRNYRSPGYLVDMSNDLAVGWLRIDPALLPRAVSSDYSGSDWLMTAYSAGADRDVAAAMVASYTGEWLDRYPDEDIKILVHTNADGDFLSQWLSARGIDHFHISRSDIFHQVAFKTIWAHLAVVQNPQHRHSWMRLLYQFGATRTLAEARHVSHRLREAAVGADELLCPGRATSVAFFADTMSDSAREIVVFDTETTGLDIFADEVVQIAAVKMRGGHLVPGSGFEVFVESSRPIPPVLAGDVANPLSELYATARKLSPADAFSAFFAYIGPDAILAGHNVDFDRAMVARGAYEAGIDVPACFHADSMAIDTLKVARLLLPRQRSHRLADLVDLLGVEGSNSHNALDDVRATVSVMSALLPMALVKRPDIEALLADKDIQRISVCMTRAYGKYYAACRRALHTVGGSLSGAVEDAYHMFTEAGYIDEIPHLDYLLELIDRAVVDPDAERHLRDQLSAHLYDLTTYHESDLFAQGIVRERVSVMTIHKAKGLEAENVIVFDANAGMGSYHDRARLLYVALSRARHRLAVGYMHAPTPVLQSLFRHFHHLSPAEVRTRIKGYIRINE